MGNYVVCKNYTQKEKNHFILLTRSHFSLIAKNCVAIGTGSLSGHSYVPNKSNTKYIFFTTSG